MKKMKKLLALLLAVVMVAGFAACTKKDGDGGTKKQKVKSQYFITHLAMHTSQPFVQQWIKS